MNPVFAAKLKPNEVFDAEGRVHTNVAAAPAFIPPNAGPPDPPTSSTTAQRGLFSTASTDTKSVASPATNPAGPTTTQNSGGENPLQQMTSTVSKWVGLSSDPPPPPPKPAVATKAPKPNPRPTQIARPPQPQHQNVAQPAAPSVPATPTAAAPPQQQQMAGFQQSSGAPPAPRNAPSAPASPPAAAMAPAEGTITG